VTSSNLEKWRIHLEAGVFPIELKETMPYFLMAYFFGWTIKDVDDSDAETIERLIILLEQFNKMENDVKGLGDLTSMGKKAGMGMM
jgi:hypothetical protein